MQFLTPNEAKVNGGAVRLSELIQLTQFRANMELNHMISKSEGKHFTCSPEVIPLNQERAIVAGLASAGWICRYVRHENEEMGASGKDRRGHYVIMPAAFE